MFAITHPPSAIMESGERTYLGRPAIEYALALRQFADYCRVLQDGGAIVRVLDANLALPDCAFVEDAAIVLDEIALICSMGVESRRAEVQAIELEIRKHRGIARIELPAMIEGGDVLRVGKTLFVGQSSRTNRAGINAIGAIVQQFGYRVVPIAVRQCLHLKTACCALPDGRILVNPAWIDAPLEIALNGFGWVKVPQQEPWGANILSLDQTVVIDSAHAWTAELIESLRFEVRRVDLSEFAKAEAGVTCLSLLVP
ncbi:MAG TPA: arginine deiminase family protein [Pirellulales bacterium]